MRKIFILMLIAFSAFQLQAQQKGKDMSPEERAEMQTSKLDEKLDLSDEQETSIKAINLQANTDLQALREEAQGSEQNDRKALLKQSREIQQQRESDIRATLTEDQQVTYDEMIEKQKQNRREKIKNRRNNRTDSSN
ncbi:MAG: hypothetical protein ACFB0B_04950 [Thermonemataceae bacterium]